MPTEKPSSSSNRDHPAFNRNAEPFFAVVMEGLRDDVDGQHFWDAVADDAIFEFLYSFPGFPQESKDVPPI